MTLAEVRTAAPTPAQLRARRRVGIALLVIATVLLVSRVFLVEPLRLRSESMSPTLRPGDHVVVLKVGGRVHAPHRHDIVVFSSPVDRELLIKRVAAIAGDSVGLADGILVVNGRAVHEAYVNHRLVDGVYFGPVRVPSGDVFVLGDNRSASTDSRSFGPVPVGMIQGRVLLRVWPPR